MATFTVTTVEDSTVAGDGALSLREAVERANATAAADTIRFAPWVEGQELTLTQRTPILITQDITIDGDRNDDGWRVTIDGADRTLVMRVAGAATTNVSLADLGIANGGIDAYGNDFSNHGGGIVVEAGHALTMTRCAVTDCFASRDGGGIALGQGSSATIVESLIRGNRASIPDSATGDYTAGGGIHLEGGALRLVRSTVSDNRAAQRGGGIHVEDGVLDVVDSTIAQNSAAKFLFGWGGGISAVDSRTSVVGSTITGNFAYNGYFPEVRRQGAGIDATGTLALANTIVAGNIAGELFGPDVYDDDLGGTLTLSNGHNIFGTAVAGAVAGDRQGVDSVLLFAATDPRSGGGVLALNGGPTPTVRLRDAADNPALSGAEPVAAGSADQRGEGQRPAPVGTNPDVGALELVQSSVSRTPSDRNDALVGTGSADTLLARAGADRLAGRGGDDRLGGEVGSDTLLGGPGNDLLDGGTGRDTASYRDAGGGVAASLADRASAGSLGADRLLRLENLEGGRFNDRLEGDAQGNALGGGGGADRLLGRRGDDTLRGGDGTDLLSGGLGADRLEAGPGRDLLAWDTLADSVPGVGSRDLVLDFGRGSAPDRLDLSALDARAAVAGDQAFAFVAERGAAFTGAGQVRWLHEGGRTLIEANVDADNAAELQIELAGLTDLTPADFVL